MKLLTAMFLILIGCILTHSQLSLSYAAMGLNLWFGKMVPSLLPFMILSGIMVRMELTDKVSLILYPIVRPTYRVRKNVCYAILTGFLCGFPMGAKVADDLYTRQMITKREAEYLLAFCNNIGPVYFCSFVLPLLGRKLMLPYLFGMYGIPLLYGSALRCTLFRDLPSPAGLSAKSSPGHTAAPLISCESIGDSPAETAVPFRKAAAKGAHLKNIPGASAIHTASAFERFLEAVDDSIQTSVQSILSLGGYMILFNLLNLIPHILTGRPLTVLSPLLEITGGLKLLGNAFPLYSLLALSFGGLSCLAQTYSCIGDSDLSVRSYILHRIVLTLLNGLFYLCWSQLSPSSFLI